MEKTSEPAILICGSGDFAARIAGSIEKECSECGCTVLMSPSGQELLRTDPTTIVMCPPCGTALAIRDEDVRMGPLSEKANAELLEHGMGQEEIFDLADRMGIPVPWREE